MTDAINSNHRTRVKICGITSVDMALEAVNSGADAIGLVFYPPSPRVVSVEKAAEIVSALPAFITTVGLFVNEDQAVIEDTIKTSGISMLQFHGNECPNYCAGFSYPYIKAIRMSEDIDLFAQRDLYKQARSLLLDTYQPGKPGGTGERFEWDRIPAEMAGEIILAGGLNAENVTDAVKQVRPYAVDVSGGVESEKGIKSPDKIRQFMWSVSIADK